MPICHASRSLSLSMYDILLPSHRSSSQMRFLTAGTGRSFAELMQGQTDESGKPYLSGVTLFVSHFTGYVLAEDIDAIDIFEKQEGQHYYSFVDVFAINQNEVCAAGEIMTLKAVIAQANVAPYVIVTIIFC